MDLTETEEIKKWWQEHTEDLYKRGFNDQENLGSKITAAMKFKDACSLEEKL